MTQPRIGRSGGMKWERIPWHKDIQHGMQMQRVWFGFFSTVLRWRGAYRRQARTPALSLLPLQLHKEARVGLTAAD